jgi:hypothetical protein
MPDEQHYVGTLLELDEALPLLPQLEAHIMNVAYKHWQQTLRIEEERRNSEAAASPPPDSRPQPRDPSAGESTSASS